MSVTFDDDHAVGDAGLLLPATLAEHLGLRALFEASVDLGDVPGRANVGEKAMTLVASLIAGGECIDDADAVRAGETDQVLGHRVAAPSTLGTFLRAFSFGHARHRPTDEVGAATPEDPVAAAPAVMTSAPFVPLMTLSRLLPTMVARWPTQKPCWPASATGAVATRPPNSKVAALLPACAGCPRLPPSSHTGGSRLVDRRRGF